MAVVVIVVVSMVPIVHVLVTTASTPTLVKVVLVPIHASSRASLVHVLVTSATTTSAIAMIVPTIVVIILVVTCGYSLAGEVPLRLRHRIL
jgi:hypothetical protein